MDLFDEEGFFTFPRDLDTLDGVPEQIAGGYIQAEDGKGFQLHPEVAAEAEAGEKRLADMQADHEYQVADLNRQIAKAGEEIREHVAGSAIHASLADLGVVPGLIEGAKALLLKELDIEIEKIGDEYRAQANGPHGPISIGHACKVWLAGGGHAFAPANVHEPGPTSAAMASLRRLLH